MSQHEELFDAQLVEFVKHVKDKTNKEFKEVLFVRPDKVKGDGPFRIASRDLVGSKQIRKTIVGAMESGSGKVTLNILGWKIDGRINRLVASYATAAGDDAEITFGDQDPDAGRILFL